MFVVDGSLKGAAEGLLCIVKACTRRQVRHVELASAFIVTERLSKQSSFQRATRMTLCRHSSASEGEQARS